jgi:hypothetical protein
MAFSPLSIFFRRRSNYSVSESSSLLEVVGVSTQPVHAIAKRYAIHRASVRHDSFRRKNIYPSQFTSFFSGLQIRCKPGEFAVFNPPPGQSCGTWANDFVNAFGGYLDNPSDAQACRYCQYKASMAQSRFHLKTVLTDRIPIRWVTNI